MHGGLFRHAGGAWNAKRRHARAGLHQQRVRVAVVAALELDHELAACEAACQADRAHAGLGAGRDEAQPLHHGEALLHQSGQVGFAGMAGAKAGASSGGLANRFHHRRKGMAQNHRAPGTEAVQVAVAVYVPQVGSLGPRHERRVAAYGAKGTHGGIHSARQQPGCARLQLTRLRHYPHL
jgi:hypothetical protein